ncbi:MAG: hypothetical protein KDJ52_20200 [Anaerolineae bacterium]|nr:hypothetical protein [Anaerolineae bacterium]
MPKQKSLQISGHIKNNMIVLDERIELPDGVKVTIIITDGAIAGASGLCGIWQDDRPVEEIVDDIVSSRSVGRDLPPYEISTWYRYYYLLAKW